MLTELRKFIEARWYGDIGVLRILLPFSWLFGILAKIRRTAYMSGLLERPSLPVPVVVVGNISVGGTGKTPVVAWLARELIRAGYRPGIVSRGYGGKSNIEPALVTNQDHSDVGDEPLLLARVSNSPVCVCRDRVAAIRTLAEQGVNVIISDDGLQHYRMRRRAELIVVDGERANGNGRLLPAGPLREPVTRLEEADVVIINGPCHSLDGKVFRLEPSDPVRLRDGVSRPWSEFKGARVWCVAGIGNPGRFRHSLELRGLDVDMVALPDHGVTNLDQLLEHRSQPIFMTEKDAVKYQSMEKDNIWSVPVSVVFESADAESIVATVIACLKAA